MRVHAPNIRHIYMLSSAHLCTDCRSSSNFHLSCFFDHYISSACPWLSRVNKLIRRVLISIQWPVQSVIHVVCAYEIYFMILLRL